MNTVSGNRRRPNRASSSRSAPLRDPTLELIRTFQTVSSGNLVNRGSVP